MGIFKTHEMAPRVLIANANLVGHWATWEEFRRLEALGLIMFGLHINQLVREGKIKAPIVIGRDHLDCGSVASPYRETEGMKDGSDAIADWPLLNALLNAASGASWVSFHHGGGVGIGYSLHAGQVTIADGTRQGDLRIERVLTNDPGIGIARHADAGYEKAIETARSQGVAIPMAEFGGK